MSIGTTRWQRRSKRTSVVAAAAAAVLVGVAVAYFFTEARQSSSQVTGGQLTVTANGFPLQFGEQQLYPSKPGDTRLETDGINAEFSVTNENPVRVEYKISAACSNNQNTPDDPSDDVVCSGDALDQYNNLHVRIKRHYQGAPIPSGSANAPWVYDGPMNTLTDVALVKLESSDKAAGNEATFEVIVWLNNDPQEVQPQGVTTPFEFEISATTPTDRP